MDPTRSESRINGIDGTRGIAKQLSFRGSSTRSKMIFHSMGPGDNRKISEVSSTAGLTLVEKRTLDGALECPRSFGFRYSRNSYRFRPLSSSGSSLFFSRTHNLTAATFKTERLGRCLHCNRDLLFSQPNFKFDRPVAKRKKYRRTAFPRN